MKPVFWPASFGFSPAEICRMGAMKPRKVPGRPRLSESMRVRKARVLTSSCSPYTSASMLRSTRAAFWICTTILAVSGVVPKAAEPKNFMFHVATSKVRALGTFSPGYTFGAMPTSAVERGWIWRVPRNCPTVPTMRKAPVGRVPPTRFVLLSMNTSTVPVPSLIG